MDRVEFDDHVRDALTNLYDYAALETHPLAAALPSRPEGSSRAEHLRQLLLDAIDRLQPPDRLCSPAAPEWRPYLVLHGRYVEGQSLQDLQNRLVLSERQLRREHSRALQALAAVMWDQSSHQSGVRPGPTRAFQVSRETLDPIRVVQGVQAVMQRRLESEGMELRISLPSELPSIVADRVLLRQILLTLLNCALHRRIGEPIALGADAQAERVRVWIEYRAGRSSDPETGTHDEIATAQYWAQSLDATLEKTAVPTGEDSQVRLLLSLPQAAQATVLVVDDQEAALRMFQRYLSMSGVHVVGVREPNQVLPQARSLHPRAIIMDVMMPAMDGWEVLQSLKADPATADIPVIICSVWDEPELAFSLGAASFMKKPITRRELLDELARLDRWDGWCAADSAAPGPARAGTAGDAS